MLQTEDRVDSTHCTRDARVRHYVERLTPRGVVPPVFSDVALCGAKVTEFVDHNGDICQACVDESRVRPVER